MKHNNTKNQAIKRKFVNREVIYCVSSLIYELGRNPDCFDNSVYFYDEILDICSKPDYEEAVRYADSLHVIYSNYFGGFVWVDRENHTISEPFDTEAEAYDNCCYENSLDPEYIEAYEHWIVTDWLAKKLEAHGEMVGDIFGLTIWGRTCSGQAILLDYVISKICEELEILEGQKNEWKV